jgi:hypothetical protein
MKSLCAAICGVSCLLLLAACEPTYETPLTNTSPVTTSPTAMYAAPAPVVAAVPPQRPCVYTSRSYISGSQIAPPELPGTTLQCINGAWHSI